MSLTPQDESEIQKNYDNLRNTISETWTELIQKSSAAKLLMEQGIDRRFYCIYLIETYHYTFHNSRNQAIAGARIDNRDIHYMKFCYRHSYEEVGHELMALHDLKNMGIPLSADQLPRPLPETEVLIAYLYWISSQGNPLQRLGYSAWAENSYEFFMPFVEILQTQIGLKKSQLSFFIEHAGVDEKHADHVEKAIKSSAKTPEDWEAITQVARTSLLLAGGLLESVVAEYQKLKKGESLRYGFLNETFGDGAAEK